MACAPAGIPTAISAVLGALGADQKYTNMISNADFMCKVREYLIDDMLIGFYREWVASQIGTALGAMSIVLVTMWVMYHGFMIISGTNKEPILALGFKSAKLVLILSLVALIAKQSPIIAEWVLDFQALITVAIVGQGTDVYKIIDLNLAVAQVFNALVDGLVGGQQAGADGKSLTTIAALVGQSGPAMLVSVLAIMAEISITLSIMLAPLFLFFLLFQQTASMFWTWVKFLLGTMVSLAVLTLISSILLNMMVLYGASVLAAFFINGAQTAVSFDTSNSALQMTTLGGLSTALLLLIPPVIMQFFNSGAAFAATAMQGMGLGNLAKAAEGPQGGQSSQTGSAGANGANGAPGEFSASQENNRMAYSHIANLNRNGGGADGSAPGLGSQQGLGMQGSRGLLSNPQGGAYNPGVGGYPRGQAADANIIRESGDSAALNVNSNLGRGGELRPQGASAAAAPCRQCGLSLARTGRRARRAGPVRQHPPAVGVQPASQQQHGALECERQQVCSRWSTRERYGGRQRSARDTFQWRRPFPPEVALWKSLTLPGARAVGWREPFAAAAAGAVGWQHQPLPAVCLGNALALVENRCAVRHSRVVGLQHLSSLALVCV